MEHKQKEEYDELGYTLIRDFLPDDVYEHIVDVFCNGEFEEISQTHEESYKRWETSDNKYFPSPDEVYIANFWGSHEVSNHPDVRRVFELYIKPIMDVITDGTADLFRHQATRYHNNGKDFLRTHYDDYMGHSGYILYLQKEDWKYDWGGLLMVDHDYIIPEINSMVVIDHKRKNPHCVTPVNYWAKENRNTLTGFCIKRGEDLPKTWTSRDDYAVY